jgi:hypothetical protein
MADKVGAAEGMEGARTRFEQWRSSRSRKSPIPDELWELAINAARQQGVNRAAQQMHLDAGAPLDNNLATAVSGSGQVMPPPGLCRVLPLLTQPAWFLTVPDAA